MRRIGAVSARRWAPTGCTCRRCWRPSRVRRTATTSSTMPRSTRAAAAQPVCAPWPRRAHAAGLGVLVDIVPNHVGVATPPLSVWWWDVLRAGPESAYAAAFDIDWDFGAGKIRLPVLGDGADELDALRIVDGELRYYEHRFPIADGTGGGTPQEVHARQHYELMNYRRADAELNYRRFFAITTLAGIRVELPEVFARVARGDRHAGCSAAGWTACGSTTRTAWPIPAATSTIWPTLIDHRYVVVEKIIEGDETLPESWACAGTSGYEALAALDRLFTDPGGRGGTGRTGHRTARRVAGRLAGHDAIHQTRCGRWHSAVRGVAAGAAGAGDRAGRRRHRRVAQFVQCVPHLPPAGCGVSGGGGRPGCRPPAGDRRCHP